jgi:hypothetical protein
MTHALGALILISDQTNFMGMDIETSGLIIKLNKAVSWTLICFTILMIVSGYVISKRLLPQMSPGWFLPREIHQILEQFFLAFFSFHFIITVFLIHFNWSNAINRIKNRGLRSLLTIKLLQRMTGWFVFVITLIAILSGIEWYNYLFGRIIPFFRHTHYDIFFFFTILVHTALGVKLVLIKRKIGTQISNIVALLYIIILTLVIAIIDSTGAVLA